MKTKMFPLSGVLTAYTGIMCGPVSELYQIVGFVLDAEGISTIGLLSAAQPIRDALEAQHPWLKQLPPVPMNDKQTPQEKVVAIDQYLQQQGAIHGHEIECMQVGWGTAPQPNDLEIYLAVQQGKMKSIPRATPTDSGE